MKIYYDFHIHTALSPCGNEDMSPVNIINMCLLKGLDVIAITDHNTILNCSPCIEVAQNKEILVIPGIEVQTKEEVHLVCLFKNLETARDFYKIIKQVSSGKNNTDFFGRQYIFDKDSNVIGEEADLLIASIDLTINQVCSKVEGLGGVVMPAHIDKKNFSIISNLGFLPMDLDIKNIEISGECDVNKFLRTHKYLNKYRIIKNSDAHYLGDISERVNYIELNIKSTDVIIDYLKSKK